MSRYMCKGKQVWDRDTCVMVCECEDVKTAYRICRLLNADAKQQ